MDSATPPSAVRPVNLRKKSAKQVQDNLQAIQLARFSSEDLLSAGLDGSLIFLDNLPAALKRTSELPEGPTILANFFLSLAVPHNNSNDADDAERMRIDCVKRSGAMFLWSLEDPEPDWAGIVRASFPRDALVPSDAFARPSVIQMSKASDSGVLSDLGLCNIGFGTKFETFKRHILVQASSFDESLRTLTPSEIDIELSTFEGKMERIRNDSTLLRVALLDDIRRRASKSHNLKPPRIRIIIRQPESAHLCIDLSESQSSPQAKNPKGNKAVKAIKKGGWNQCLDISSRPVKRSKAENRKQGGAPADSLDRDQASDDHDELDFFGPVPPSMTPSQWAACQEMIDHGQDVTKRPKYSGADDAKLSKLTNQIYQYFSTLQSDVGDAFRARYGTALSPNQSRASAVQMWAAKILQGKDVFDGDERPNGFDWRSAPQAVKTYLENELKIMSRKRHQQQAPQVFHAAYQVPQVNYAAYQAPQVFHAAYQAPQPPSAMQAANSSSDHSGKCTEFMIEMGQIRARAQTSSRTRTASNAMLISSALLRSPEKTSTAMHVGKMLRYEDDDLCDYICGVRNLKEFIPRVPLGATADANRATTAHPS